MPRQRLHQDLTELAARLPWWIGLLCAVASYLLLRPVAVLHAPAPTSTLDTAATAIGQLLVGLASVAQYLVPLVFLALAATSVFLQWKRQDLRWSLESNPGTSGLRGLSQQNLTALVAAAYRARGFKVQTAGSGLQHDGIDLELRGDDKSYLLQLRNWKSSRLDATELRALHGAVMQNRADGALVLISGHFTRDAISFAADKPIALIDGRALKQLILSRGSGTLSALFDGIRRRTEHHPPPIPAEKQNGNAMPSCAGDAAPDQVDDAERTLGSSLGALIRDEMPPAPSFSDRFSAMPSSPPPKRNHPLRGSGETLRAQIHAPIGLGRIANAIGMVLALGLMWVTYQWFDALPAIAETTPWSLLGKAPPGQSRVTRSDLEDLRGSDGKPLPPLGQLLYGPDFRLEPLPGTVTAQPTPAADPIEIFHSVRELEDAFNARYVPPPSCYDWSSPTALASCGNHRIRARQAFIASNGRSMVPVERPPEPRPRAPEWAALPDDASATWEEEDYWREIREQHPEEIGLAPVPDWRSETPNPGYPAQRYPQPPPEPAPDRYGTWWPPEAPATDWQRPGWDTPAEPPSQGFRLPPSGAPDGGYSVPRIQRRPVEDWLPRERVSTGTWREEELLREQRFDRNGDTWNQTAEPFEDSPYSQSPDALGEPIPDWRRDWLR